MNGQTLNDNQNVGASDQAWVFLTEVSLPEFLGNIDMGDERKQDLLDHLTEELDIPPECLLKLEQVLSEFAREAAVRSKQEKIALPVSFRLFCQQKMVDEQMNGGWGYFLIERTMGSVENPAVRSQHFVNLYIYQEGE